MRRTTIPTASRWLCVALLLAPACAPASDPETAPLAAARCEPVASDSVDATIYLTLQPGGDGATPTRRATADERRISALALLAIREAMTPPDRALTTAGTLALHRGPEIPGSAVPPTPAVFTVEAWDAWRRGRAALAPMLRIRATLHEDGRLTDIERTTPPSVMPGLDRALAAALARVGDAQRLAGLRAEMRGLAAAAGEPNGSRAGAAASMELSFRVGLAPDSLLGSLPLLEAKLPVYDGAALAVSLPGNPPPLYPDDARFRGEGGEVLVEFVVTPDGRTDRSSLRVLRATGDDFAGAVERVVPRYRFMPAEANGCAVPTLVRMPFGFRVP